MTNQKDGKKSRALPTAPSEQDIADQMAKCGITRVPVDYFHVAGYRYTNLRDAVVQAKRRPRRI
jgi:hypothetical protein